MGHGDLPCCLGPGGYLRGYTKLGSEGCGRAGLLQQKRPQLQGRTAQHTRPEIAPGEVGQTEVTPTLQSRESFSGSRTSLLTPNPSVPHIHSLLTHTLPTFHPSLATDTHSDSLYPYCASWALLRTQSGEQEGGFQRTAYTVSPEGVVISLWPCPIP